MSASFFLCVQIRNVAMIQFDVTVEQKILFSSGSLIN